MNFAKLSPEDELEIRRIFLSELGANRDLLRELLRRLEDGDTAALSELGDLCHRMAGAAHSAGMPLLGYLLGLCEDFIGLGTKGNHQIVERAAKLFAPALSGMDAVLELAVPSQPVMSVSKDPPVLVLPPTFPVIGLGKDQNQHSDNLVDRIPAKILVIDDDIVSAKHADAILRSAGMTSSYCCDPEAAIRTILSELPDLIILDVAMPRISGFELCRQVRAHPALHFTPIIFVTRNHDVNQRVQGLEAGGNDYLSKPVEPQEFVARIRAHLGRLSVLRDMAIRDGLTKCFNHAYFKARTDQEISRAKRYDDGMSLIMLDIDHFKQVNDRHGHPAGDLVLSHTVNLIIGCLRATDLVGRHGGEEFGILMMRTRSPDPEIIANRLREQIAGHRFLVPSNGELYVEVRVTVSMGVAHLQPKDTVHSLLARADRALYEAKGSGRNRVCVAP